MFYTLSQLRRALVAANIPSIQRELVIDALRMGCERKTSGETNGERAAAYRQMCDMAMESIQLMQPGCSFYRPAWADRIGVSRRASLRAVHQACADGLLTYTGHQYVRQRLPTDAR